MNEARIRDDTFTWRVHLPNMLSEVMCNPGTSALAMPMKILCHTLFELAELAVEINDPRLNLMMFDLTLYEAGDMNITSPEESRATRKAIIESVLEQRQATQNPAPEPTSLELYDSLGQALMDTRPDLEDMSLDEWLHEHHEHLSDAERAIATNIIDLHMERT